MPERGVGALRWEPAGDGAVGGAPLRKEAPDGLPNVLVPFLMPWLELVELADTLGLLERVRRLLEAEQKLRELGDRVRVAAADEPGASSAPTLRGGG